jgi:hypothetical protein
MVRNVSGSGRLCDFAIDTIPYRSSKALAQIGNGFLDTTWPVWAGSVGGFA